MEIATVAVLPRNDEEEEEDCHVGAVPRLAMTEDTLGLRPRLKERLSRKESLTRHVVA